MGGAAKQTDPLACGALQQPANDGEGGGDRGEGAVRVSVSRLGVDAWTVFHLSSTTPRVVTAVRSAISGEIRAEKVESVCCMGLKA